MIVELFGLPGSGKSYCCNELEKKNDFENIMNFYKEEFLGKILFHLFLKFCLINKDFNMIYKKVLEIVKKEKHNINFITKNNDIELYIKYIIFIYFIEKRKNKKNIIIDEGTVHFCMVLYAEYGVEINKCLKILDYFDNKMSNSNRKVYGIQCDINTSIKRMKDRNRKRAPIDFLREEELIIILNKYNEFIEYCKDRYNITEIKKILVNLSEEKDD